MLDWQRMYHDQTGVTFHPGGTTSTPGGTDTSGGTTTTSGGTTTPSGGTTPAAGGTTPAAVDETKQCPRCGQTLANGYVVRPMGPGLLLYSPACGFLKYKLGLGL